MLQHPTLDRLNAMGLAGMARAFDELAANAEAERLTHPEWLALLLDREWSFRHDRKLAARLRFAKLRHQATPRMSIIAAIEVSTGAVPQARRW